MAGSYTTTIISGSLLGGKTDIKMAKVAFIADASNGSFPSADVEAAGGFITNVYVNPGTTAPTDAIDLTVELGTTGIDLLGGAGANITTAADAIITPKNTLGDMSMPGFAGDLLVKITGNSVNSAGVDVYLILTA